MIFLVWILFAKSGFSRCIYDGVWRCVLGYHICIIMRLYDIVLAVHLHVRMFLVDTFTLAGVAVLCGRCGCFCPT